MIGICAAFQVKMTRIHLNGHDCQSDEKMETLEKRMYKKNFVRRYNCIVQSTTIKVHDLMVLADTEGRYHIRYGVCVYTSLK
jgi:hypothetical protein